MNTASAITEPTFMALGQCVVICDGMLSGLRGTVLAFDDHRVVLSILLRDGPLITSVDVDRLTPEGEYNGIPILQH
jgi:hypothetical protein